MLVAGDEAVAKAATQAARCEGLEGELEAVRRQLASAEGQGERLGKEHRMLSEALAESSKPKAPSLWSKRVCSPVGGLQEESRRN